jgi:AbrB family looped-hinge helix DNA binding protein
MTNDNVETTKVGKKGIVVIPAPMRQRFGLSEGSLAIIEEKEDGIFIRPAVALPVEMYSPERIAEFMLSNAGDSVEYEKAKKEVKNMGLNPEEICHIKPEI